MARCFPYRAGCLPMTAADDFFARAEKLLARFEQSLPPLPDSHVEDGIAWRWRKRNGRGWLDPITRFNPVALDDLQHIEVQKEELTRNTRQFLAGLPANNALLWGPRGTGKSSLVKALLNAYAPAGLRLVEVERHDLVDGRDAELPAEGLHAAGFELEHGCRHAAAEQFVGRAVVKRDLPDVKIRARPPDQFDRVIDDRQRLESEEIHLEHAELGERAHGVLGHHFLLIAAGERHVDVEVGRTDDDPGGVHAGPAGQSFEPGGVLPEFGGGGFIGDGGSQFRIFRARLLERDVELIGDHFGDAVGVAVAPAEHAPDVPDD